MKRLFILTLTIISCTEPNPIQKIENDDTVSVSKSDFPVASQQKTQDSIVTFDSSIYRHYIAADVMRLVHQLTPQWQLPEPGSWDAFWFNQYKKDSALVNYISGDFNCDGKQDYSLLLTNAKEGFAVWVYQSAKEAYKAIKLDEFGHMEKPIEMGLQFIEAGQLDYLDENAEDVKSISLKCPAISVIFFEKAAVTYYWQNGTYVEVQTGD